jgi:hypothetical protein
MKKLFLFFLIFIDFCLVSGISVYPITINESTEEIIIQNYFDKEILLSIELLNFEKNIQSGEKIIFDIDEKTFSHKNEMLEINVIYENLNFVFEIPIEIEKKKKKIPIFIISSIVLGICVVIIMRKF